MTDNYLIINCLFVFSCTKKSYLKSDNTGVISFEDFSVLYNKERGAYVIDVYVCEGTSYSFSVKYAEAIRGKGNDVLYLYKGVRDPYSKELVCILTRVKLSEYTKNRGWNTVEEINNWEKETILFLLPESFTSFNVAPIKNTSAGREIIKEKRKKKEEKYRRQSLLKKRFDNLFEYGEKYIKDSLNNQVVKEVFDNGRKVESFDLDRHYTYEAVIDTNKRVTIIRKDGVVFNNVLDNERLNGKVQYESPYNFGRYGNVINDKVFFCMNFSYDVKEEKYHAVVIYDSRGFSYFEDNRGHYSVPHHVELPENIKKLVENNIKKKGKYSIDWKTLDDKLVYLSYKKDTNGIFKVPKTNEIYSIYK